MPAKYSRPPLTIRSYAIGFIAVVSLLFGGLSWAILNKMTTARATLEFAEKQSASLEISQAATLFFRETDSIGQKISIWDETRQQLSDSSYYVYWRDGRVLESGVLPGYVEAVELYSRQKMPLAGKGLLPYMPSRIPDGADGGAENEDGFAYAVRRDGLTDVYQIIAIRDGENVGQVTGYAVARLNFFAMIRDLQAFRYVDVGSLHLSMAEGERIPIQQLWPRMEYKVISNQEVLSLLDVIFRSQMQMAAAVLLISILFYAALSELVAKPLRRLSRHIDSLRDGSGQMLDMPFTQEPVMELEKVRASLNDYQHQLNSVHARLDSQNVELWGMAHRDPLTGVFNRLSFEEDWKQMQNVATGHRVEVSFLLFDCDHFKPINDTYGHLVGDQLLQRLAQTLQNTLRAGDRLYRIGGDEFAAIFLDASPDDVLDVAKRCEAAIDSQDFFNLGIREPIRMSVGLAHASGTQVEELVTLQKQADVAMYHAKRPGYGKLVAYSEEMSTESEALFSNQSVSAVFEAISGKGAVLEMHYQPVVSLKNRQIDYFEALVRIRRDHELLMPKDIFPVVTGRRLEAHFDYVVLDRVLRDLAEGVIPEGTGVSLNISGPTIVHPDICEKLGQFKTYFGRYKLVIEITETALITQLQQASANLGRLRSEGFIVALDDFGSGYSSLGYMANMPVDVVKFDISLIRSLDKDNRHSDMVESLVKMISTAGYCVVAEGVETEQTLEKVRRIGFSHVQGYLFGRPAAKAAAELLC
ncbi:MAG: EAL domain-containing protein [Sulfuricellaceae bacterium]|nr:EAL domain-containing protein [Sulfuricellaceae bacterium]